MFLKLTSTFSLPNVSSRSPTASLFPFERTSQLQYGSHMMETLLKLTSNFYLYREIKKFRKNKDKILFRDLMNRCVALNPGAKATLVNQWLRKRATYRDARNLKNKCSEEWLALASYRNPPASRNINFTWFWIRVSQFVKFLIVKQT